MNKHRNSSSRLWMKRLGWVFFAIFLAVGAFLVGYFIGFDQAQEELIQERQQTERLIEQIKDIASIDEKTIPALTGKEAKQEAEIRKLKQELREMLERERKREALKPQHEYAPKEPKAAPPPPEKRRERPLIEGEAKLVIIIDDVSYARDLKLIESTGLPLVMSYLPPSSRHPDSANLARQSPFYMVHLPLEAMDYDSEEPNTLRIGDSEEKMAERIAALKKLYPNVRYMNNHTGSKFTADADAVEKLVRVMKKEGVVLVDSRTTAQTKIPDVSQKAGLRYLGRDVFLDHQDGVANVKKQIAEAVEKAKRHGSAIAIGHPRPDTIRALKESKELLSEVKLVRIDQI